MTQKVIKTNVNLPYTPQKNITLFLVIFGIFVSIFLALYSDDKTIFPIFELYGYSSDNFTFSSWINAGEGWMKDNYRWFTRAIAGVIKGWYYFAEDFLIDSPWLIIFLLLVLPSLRVAGLRLTLFVIFTLSFWGLTGLWNPAMQTLALMGISVFASVFFGVLIGLWCSQSDRVEATIRPFLDIMQVMPAFVYLIPAVFFFGVGGPPAIIASMIYAMPPIIRLTNLGIRQVSHETIETAESFGSSRFQMLTKIQIPLALPSIMMGINQTIMMALGLVVLAAFIGAQGLGYQVWKAIKQLDNGFSIEAGLCILFMAIMFDRFSAAFNNMNSSPLPKDQVKFHLLPQTWDSYSIPRLIEKFIDLIFTCVGRFFSGLVFLLGSLIERVLSLIDINLAKRVSKNLNTYVFFFSSLIILISVYICDIYILEIGEFPKDLRLSIRSPIDAGVDWLATNSSVVAFTKSVRIIIYFYLLNPLDYYFSHLPWWFLMAALMLISYAAVGVRFAIICGILLTFIGFCNIWQESMITLSSVIVSVIICFIIGVPLGIFAAYNKRFERFQAPILDAMQTLPAFCYLVPIIMVFGANKTSVILATVIYSIVPMIRLTILGLTQIPESYTEVSKSFGGTTLQTLIKIKYPMAIPNLVMGFNQTVMMAFAMQIVTPLIGGKGLGREVYQALAKSDTGKGLAAGMAICLLAIIIDRISMAVTKKQRDALGLSS